MIEKYRGRQVEIIYQDRSGRLSQRTVLIHSIRNGKVKAFCLAQQAPRVFHIDGILAVQPILRRLA